MRRINFIWKTSIVILMSVILANCQNEKKTKQESNNILLEVSDSNSKSDISYFRFPSPEEIFEYIEYEDLEFKPNITNNPSNASKYNYSHQQALNLGVYVSDIAYNSFFSNADQTFMYLSAVKRLTGNLKMDGAFSSDFIERLTSNLNNVDSLTFFSAEAYKKIVNYLEQNDNNRVLSLLSIGTYIESLYLIMAYIDDYDKQIDLIQRISDQRFAFENLNEFILVHLDPEVDKDYILMVSDIKKVFDEMDSDHDPNQENEFILSKDSFNKMKETVNKKREMIIK